MTDIIYKRSFKHDDWIDNEDVVAAGGERGFNAKFHDLEAEFDSLSSIIAQFSSAINALISAPPPQPARLTLTPAFVALIGAPAWAYVEGAAVKPDQATDAKGMVSLNLPNKARITALRAIGQNAGRGKLTVTLYRHPLASPIAPLEPISSVNCSGDPFDCVVNVSNTPRSLIDGWNYNYLAVANLNGSAVEEITTITAIQISYQPEND